MSSVQTARAHDPTHKIPDDWFEGLKSTGGNARCCDGKDANHVDNLDWGTKDGHYWVRIDGKVVDVPDSAVIKEPNLAGFAMEWHTYNSSLGGPLNILIRCFMPGLEG